MSLGGFDLQWLFGSLWLNHAVGLGWGLLAFAFVAFAVAAIIADEEGVQQTEAEIEHQAQLEQQAAQERRLRSAQRLAVMSDALTLIGQGALAHAANKQPRQATSSRGKCSASGCKGNGMRKCPQCKGSGETSTGWGNSQQCPSCKGTFEIPCSGCA